MKPSGPARFRIGELELDLDQCTAGEKVLTEQDCALLHSLVARQQGIVTRSDLYREVWGYHSMPRGRALDFAIRRLREKIEPDSVNPIFLTTERGRGFRLRWSPLVQPPEDVLSFALPSPRTPWIGGRDRVLALIENLESKARLICIHGPAGVGKTRLMIEAFSSREPPIWVRAGAETDTGALFTILSRSLGASELPLDGDDDSLCSGLVGALPQSAEDRLLVIDGAQKHVDVLRKLLPLLLAETSLRIVLGSQTRLGIKEEHLFEMEVLDEEQALCFLQEKLDSVAGKVPIESADLRSLVQHLDGLPLALELAAPMLRALTPSQLENRLREGGGLLSDHSAGLSPGQLVREAVSRLPEDEQLALSLLSAFPYGLTLDVAQCVLEPIADPLRLLTNLMDHSLLHRTAANNGPPRFRTLWIVARELGAGGESGISQDARDLSIAEQAGRWARPEAERTIHQPGQSALRHVLRGEFGHADVWVQALLRCGRVEEGVELALAFAHLMSWAGLTRDALGLAQRSAEGLDSKRARCRLFSTAAELGASLQDAGAVDAYLGEVALDGLDDEWCQGRWALAALTVAVARGQFGRGPDLLEQLRSKLDDDPWLLGRADRMEHSIFAMLGEVEDAKSVLEDLRVHAEAANDDLMRVKHGISLGFHAFSEGRADDAVYCYRKALPMAAQLGHRELEAGLHRRLALALQAAGDEEGARRSRKRALSLTNPDDNPDVQAHLLASEAEYLHNRGDFEEACELARRACTLSMKGAQYNTTMSCLRDGVVVGLGSTGEYPFYDLLEELETRGVDRESNTFQVTVSFVRGMLALRAGKQDKALDYARKGYGLCEPFIGQLDAVYLLGQLATLAAEAGGRSLATTWLERAEGAYKGESWRTVLDEDAWYQRARVALKQGP